MTIVYRADIRPFDIFNIWVTESSLNFTIFNSELNVSSMPHFDIASKV